MAVPREYAAPPLVTQVAQSPGPARLVDWDELVRSVPGADVAQLSGWARLRGQAGYRALWVFVDEGDRLAGGAQILVRRLPGLGEVGYLSNGPLVSPAADDPVAVQDALADAIASLGRRWLRILFVQPSEGAERTSDALVDRGFRHSDAGIAPTASLRIDLSVDEAQLRRNLSRTLRGLSNQWDCRGVTVRRSTDEDLPLLADLLAATVRRRGATPFGTEYLATMHRELAPAGHLVGFVGEAAGRPVAMLLLTGCGGVVRRRLVGFDRSEDVRPLNVPAAIDWTAIRWAKENGYRWYDFVGVHERSLPLLLAGSPADIRALAAPDQYKARFGGQVFTYPPPVEMIRPAAVRIAYDLARRTTAGRAVVDRAKLIARTGAAAASAVRDARPLHSSG